MSRSNNVTWRCFHCDDEFSDAGAASEHFGTHWDETPLCKVVDNPAAALRLMSARGWATPRKYEAQIERALAAEDQVDALEQQLYQYENWPAKFDGARTLWDAADTYDNLKFSHANYLNVPRSIRWLVRLVAKLRGWNS